MITQYDCRRSGCEILIHPDDPRQWYCRYCNQRFYKSNNKTDDKSNGSFFLLFIGLLILILLLSLSFSEEINNSPQEFPSSGISSKTHM